MRTVDPHPTPRARRERSARSRAPGAVAAILACASALALAPSARTQTEIPVVHGFTPHEGETGTIVKIAGENLDQVLWIEFANGVRADFRIFTTRMLKVAVPEGAESGPILLRTEQAGAWAPGDFRVIEPPAGGLRLSPPFPNPGAAPYRLGFNLPAPLHVQLDVLDVRGRRIRRLLDGLLGRGPQLAIWDGRDAGGGRAAPGLYLVVLRNEKGILSRRLVVRD